MTRNFVLPVDVSRLEEGGFYAVCPSVQGCHAVGDTVPEALQNLEDVAGMIFDFLKEKGLPLPEDLQPEIGDAPLKEQILVKVEA